MNCKKGNIIEYDISDRMILYSIHLDDSELCEFDKFIYNFRSNALNKGSEKVQNDLYIILAAIDEIVKRGAREGRFRGENNVHALPTVSCNLRLYCIRLHFGAVLLGNGGIKTSQKLQDSPDCYLHYQLMVALEKQISNRIQNKEMFWDGDFLQGDFYFELGDCSDKNL